MSKRNISSPVGTVDNVGRVFVVHALDISRKNFPLYFLKKNSLSVHSTKNLDEILRPKPCVARLRTKYFISKEFV